MAGCSNALRITDRFGMRSSLSFGRSTAAGNLISVSLAHPVMIGYGTESLILIYGHRREHARHNSFWDPTILLPYNNINSHLCERSDRLLPAQLS